MSVESGRQVGAAVANQRAGPGTSTRLSGERLRLVRALWAATVSLTSILFMVSIPLRREQLVEVVANLTPAQEAVLSELGVSSQQHAGFVVSVEVGVTIVFFALGLLIYSRRSDDWVAMLVSAALFTYICWISPTLDALIVAWPDWRLAGTIVQVVGMLLGVSFFYYFPDGRMVPRWTVLLLGLWAGWGALWLALPGSVFDLADPFMLPLGVFALHMSWWVLGMTAQAYRYLRVATPVQQQQTKLVLFGVSVGLFGYVLFGFNRFAVPVLAEPMHASIVYDLIGVPMFLLVHIVVPVSFAVAILRYRLWDIDLIINRALVYGLLTAILAGLYTASITFSQRLFTALTGERSDAAIVLTTLVVASAFTPVKSSLQNVVDRYLKRAPDPIENLRAFAGQVRTLVEVIDTDQLTGKALAEAVRAFDAAGGAVYLMREGRYQQVHTTGDWGQLEGMSAWFEAEGSRYGWLVVGPRRSGVEYSMQDRRALADTVSLVAQAIKLVEGADFARSSHASSLAAEAVGGDRA